MDAFRPEKFPKLQKPDLRHLDARISFNPPEKIRAPPRRDPMPTRRIPQKSRHLPHAIQYKPSTAPNKLMAERWRLPPYSGTSFFNRRSSDVG